MLSFVLFPVTCSRDKQGQEAIAMVGQKMRMVWTGVVTAKVIKSRWDKNIYFSGRAARVG